MGRQSSRGVENNGVPDQMKLGTAMPLWCLYIFEIVLGVRVCFGPEAFFSNPTVREQRNFYPAAIFFGYRLRR
jgi:hypothetical protein